MAKELFGVFDDADRFRDFRSTSDFDALIEADGITVGVRDPRLGKRGSSAVYQGADGACVVFGEIHPPEDHAESPAQWCLNQYVHEGQDFLNHVNGAYLMVLAGQDHEMVVTDPLRTWEGFYTDAPGTRVFGTDATVVAQTIPKPTLREDAMLELLLVGIALDSNTLIEELGRIPFDNYLTRNRTESLDRFVYEPRQFDYVDSLAERLRRAIQRRMDFPGPKGLLLSGGYDSRIILAMMPELRRCYTVGSPSSQEVMGAGRVAEQYGVDHTVFPPNARYLDPNGRTKYSQGSRETIHIHHAGYTDEITANTVYHGLVFDTLLSGKLIPRSTVGALGLNVPLQGMEPDPEPIDFLLKQYEFKAEPSNRLVECTGISTDPEQFIRERFTKNFNHAMERAHSLHNGLNAFGIINLRSLVAHYQLVDNFCAPFVAADQELISWHLNTPPEYRSKTTYIKASKQLDPDILRNPPPDRPHHSQTFNAIERYLRRKLPLFTPFESPWPNRERIFDRYDLDAKLLPEFESVHDPLPARYKLRIYDIGTWLASCAPRAARDFDRLIKAE